MTLIDILAREYDYPDDPINNSLKAYMQKLSNIIENIKKGDKDSQAIYKFIDRRVKDLFWRGRQVISPDIQKEYKSIEEKVEIIIPTKIIG